jgi:hypothetical protein
MAAEEMKAFVDKLNNSGKMSFVDAATEEQIELFENNNNTKLPQKYKDWLLVSDGGDLFLPAGVQLYGVSHKPIIDVNEDDRPGENYVVIGAMASGDPVLFEKDSEQVAIYNHADGVIDEEELYSDFVAFLNDLIDSFGSEE